MASAKGALAIWENIIDFARGVGSGVEDTVELIQRGLRGGAITPQQARELKQVLEEIRPSPAPVPIQGSQLRIPITQPGKGARAYSPRGSAGEGVTDIIRSEQRALPAESSASRMRGIATEAEQAGLMGRVDPEILMRLQRGGASPTFLQEASRQARLSQVPRTTAVRGPALMSGAPAPEPQFSIQRMSDELMSLRQADPGTFRAIAELSAPLAQKTGASILEVVEAVTGPNGNKVINFIEAGNDLPTSVRLAQGGPMVPTRGSAMTRAGDPGALVRSPGGSVVNQAVEDVNVRVLDPEMLSAAVPGVQKADFGLLRNVDPAILAGLGLTAGGVGVAGLSRMAGGGDRTPSMPQGINEAVDQMAGQPQMQPSPPLKNPVTAQPPGVPPIDPTVPPPTVPGAVPPGGSNIDPTLPAPVVINGDRESERREQLAQADPRAAAVERLMEPMSPERYKSIADYYRDRAAYSSQPEVKRELIKYAGGTGSSPEISADLEIWAQNFPGLAYEMQRRALKNSAADQQSPETFSTPTVVGTQMGSDNKGANPEGAAEAAGAQAVNPTAGGADLQDATQMIQGQKLQRAQDLLENVLMGR
jgi:hypothetical protein